MDVNARRAVRIKQLLGQPVLVVANDRSSLLLTMQRERIAQRRGTPDVDPTCSMLLVSDDNHRILPLCCQVWLLVFDGAKRPARDERRVKNAAAAVRSTSGVPLGAVVGESAPF
jgi:hypothetical protein